MHAQSLYMFAVMASIAVAAIAKTVLLRRPHHDNRLLARKQDTMIYAASKLAPVLAVAFAVADDADSRTSTLNAAVGVGGLILVAGLTTWSIYACLIGQFLAGLIGCVRTDPCLPEPWSGRLRQHIPNTRFLLGKIGSAGR